MAKQTVRENHLIKWAILLVLLLVGLFGLYFYSTHEKITFHNYLPKDEAYLHNKFHTAEFLLKKQNKKVHRLSSESDVPLRTIWQDLDNAKGKLMIIQNIDHQQTTDVAMMLEWVQAGGHLLAFSQSRPDEYDLSDEYDHWEAINDLNRQNALMTVLGLRFAYVGWHSFEELDTLQDLGSSTVPLVLLTGETIVANSQSVGRFSDDFISFLESLESDDADTENLLTLYYNYEWVRDEIKPYNYELFEKGKVRSKLTADDQKLLTAYKRKNKAGDYFLAGRALYDAQLGAGRITLLASDEMLENPTPYTADMIQIDEPQEAKEHDQAIQDQKRQSKTPLVDALQATESQTQSGYYDGLMLDDNAYLLTHLTQNARDVWFVRNFKRPPLWELVWQAVPYLVLASGFLLILGFFALSRQFGHYKTVQDDSAVNLLGFFEGLGDYYWRADKMYLQVAQNRNALFDRLSARLPLIATLTDSDDICLAIADHLTTDPDSVALALYGEWQSEQEFLVVAQAFQRLAKKVGL